MSKKLFLALLFLLPAGTMLADDFKYIAFENASGEVQTLGVDGLKIAFTDGNLVATSNDGTRTLALSTLAKMYFTQSPTGIEQQGIAAEENASTEVFDLQGRLCCETPR